MAETTANSEFWRELKPIAQKFRPGALPEAYIADAPTDDPEDEPCEQAPVREAAGRDGGFRRIRSWIRVWVRAGARAS